MTDRDEEQPARRSPREGPPAEWRPEEWPQPRWSPYDDAEDPFYRPDHAGEEQLPTRVWYVGPAAPRMSTARVIVLVCTALLVGAVVGFAVGLEVAASGVLGDLG